MTYEDLKEKDKDRMRHTNRKSQYALSAKDMEAIAKKHRKSRIKGDEYACLLLEYRLDDINFHTEASLLCAGEYEKVLEMVKTW